MTGDDTSSSGVDSLDASTGAEPVTVIWEGPGAVWAVGPVDLGVIVSDNVVAVELRRSEQLVATLTPPQLAFVWDVVGDAQDGEHTWTATARTAADEQAESVLVIAVDVPASGQPVWQDVVETSGPGWGRAVAVDDAGGVVMIGYENDDNSGQTVLRRYQDASVAWTRTPGDWSLLPDAEDLLVAVDVALDLEGNIIVAGTIGARYYLAKLEPAGELVWERLGNIGETANGVSVDDDGRIYLAGAMAIGDDTKLAVWSWSGDNKGPWFGAWEDTNDLGHKRSEQGHAVVRIGDRVIVAGEREVFDLMDDLLVERTLVVQFTPAGELQDELTWSSVGDYGGRDGALDIVAVGDEYCITGHSRGPEPAVRRILTRCSDALQPWWSSEDAHGTGYSVAANHRLEVVVVGEAQGSGQVQAFVPGAAAPAWTFSTNQQGRLRGVACDAWGTCSYAGLTKGPPSQWMAGGLTP